MDVVQNIKVLIKKRFKKNTLIWNVLKYNWNFWSHSYFTICSFFCQLVVEYFSVKNRLLINMRRKKYSKKNCGPLRCIVTGWEHSGTTIVSRLIKCHPDLFGAVETGLLLAKSPSDFISVKPFANWMRSNRPESETWRVSEEGFKKILSCKTFEEAYTQLHKESPITKNTSYQIVDKTPRYIRDLYEILAKVPGVPCVVIVKSRKSMYDSFCKKRHISKNYVDSAIFHIWKNLYHGLTKFPDRVFVVKYEKLIKHPYKTMKRIFDFIEIDWKSEFLNLNLYIRKWEKAIGQIPLRIGIFKYDSKIGKEKFVRLVDDKEAFNRMISQ